MDHSDTPIHLRVQPIVGRARGQLASPLDGRYGAMDPDDLQEAIKRLVHQSELEGIDYVLGIPEGSYIPAYAFAAEAGLRLVLASIWEADAPGVVTFTEDHNTKYARAKYFHGLQTGDRVIVVEDEVSSGQTMVNCVRALRAAGMHCDQVATIYAANDPGMRARLAEEGIRLHAVALCQANINEQLYGRWTAVPRVVERGTQDMSAHVSHLEAFADVDAIILAGGRGTRLGHGPKAFVPLGGQTLLERAVATMLTVAARVIVAVPQDDIARAQDLVASDAVRIIGGGARRVDTLRSLVAAAAAPWLVLHDVVHPFVTAELAHRVLDAARESGAASAALANIGFLYGLDGERRATPGELMTSQKPAAFRRTDIARGFAAMERSARGDPIPDMGALTVLAEGGQRATFVPGYRINYKLTTPEDLALAQRLIAAP